MRGSVKGRNPYAAAHSMRGGAGAGSHRDGRVDPRADAWWGWEDEGSSEEGEGDERPRGDSREEEGPE